MRAKTIQRKLGGAVSDEGNRLIVGLVLVTIWLWALAAMMSCESLVVLPRPRTSGRPGREPPLGRHGRPPAHLPGLLPIRW